LSPRHNLIYLHFMKAGKGRRLGFVYCHFRLKL
jgi:hypothetical protein